MTKSCFTCDVCGAAYTDLAVHLYHHPECDEDADLPELVVCSPCSSECGDFCDLEALDELDALIAADHLKDEVAADLAELRFEHGYGPVEIDRVKALAAKWVRARDAQVHRDLAAFLRPGVKPEQVAAALGARSIFDGLETSAKDLGYFKQLVPYLEPRVAQLSDNLDDKVVSFDISIGLTRKLQHDASFRSRVLKKSEQLKTGELYETLPEGTMSDTLEAAEARFHPHLWRPASEDEKDDVRVPLAFSCDDVEVQPARTARALHTPVARSHACTPGPPMISVALSYGRSATRWA